MLTTDGATPRFYAEHGVIALRRPGAVRGARAARRPDLPLFATADFLPDLRLTPAGLLDVKSGEVLAAPVRLGAGG
jgi:hypothetical protein